MVLSKQNFGIVVSLSYHLLLCPQRNFSTQPSDEKQRRDLMSPALGNSRNHVNDEFSCSEVHRMTPKTATPMPATIPATEAGVGRAAAFITTPPTVVVCEHWSYAMPWQARELRLAQIGVAEVPTSTRVAATVVPPPPGMTTVTPKPVSPSSWVTQLS